VATEANLSLLALAIVNIQYTSQRPGADSEERPRRTGNAHAPHVTRRSASLVTSQTCQLAAIRSAHSQQARHGRAYAAALISVRSLFKNKSTAIGLLSLHTLSHAHADEK
jgi:hypothetical protein